MRFTVAAMPKLIAIVEDEPDQRSNYEEAILGKGYRVTAYATRLDSAARPPPPAARPPKNTYNASASRPPVPFP